MRKMMKAACRISALAEADLPAYKALRDRMLLRHPQAFTSDAETEARREADSYRSRIGGQSSAILFSLCAWIGPDMVGAITVEREPRLKVRHVAHIVGMMVDDHWQGQGLGARLLDAALLPLQDDASLDLVVLSVTSSNAAALRLYASRGFERYGRLQGAIKLPDGELLDKDLMRLALRR